jgi:hypothetical protein
MVSGASDGDPISRSQTETIESTTPASDAELGAALERTGARQSKTKNRKAMIPRHAELAVALKLPSDSATRHRVAAAINRAARRSAFRHQTPTRDCGETGKPGSLDV